MSDKLRMQKKYTDSYAYFKTQFGKGASKNTKGKAVTVTVQTNLLGVRNEVRRVCGCLSFSPLHARSLTHTHFHIFFFLLTQATHPRLAHTPTYLPLA